MGKTTKYTERKFLGTLPENPSKLDIRFHQKHEKAYLKGHKFFRFGYERSVDPVTGSVRTVRDFEGNPSPLWFPVKEQITINVELKEKLTKRNG